MASGSSVNVLWSERPVDGPLAGSEVFPGEGSPPGLEPPASAFFFPLHVLLAAENKPKRHGPVFREFDQEEEEEEELLESQSVLLTMIVACSPPQK